MGRGKERWQSEDAEIKGGSGDRKSKLRKSAFFCSPSPSEDPQSPVNFNFEY